MNRTRATRPAADPGKTSRIHIFKSIEEEAAFWDSHSSAEFEDELEHVTDVRFAPAGTLGELVVRLDQDSLATLGQHAAARGLQPSELAREWILDRLRAIQDTPRAG